MSETRLRWQAIRDVGPHRPVGDAVSGIPGDFYLRRSSTSTQEHPLIRSALLGVTVLGCLISPVVLRAQATEQIPAFAVLEASLTFSTLRGEASSFVGGTGLLSTGGRLAVGGAGWIQATDAAIPTGTQGSELELLVAYGGVAVQVALRDREPVGVFVRALLGAGSARVRLPVVGTEIAADNFGVVEPEVAILRHLPSIFSIGAGLGYRFVFGVEDLPGVRSGDLRGPVARLFVRVGIS
ncbi:MAG: hypothetical protein P8170_02890 [Gemmatimonadota bacterium]